MNNKSKVTEADRDLLAQLIVKSEVLSLMTTSVVGQALANSLSNYLLSNGVSVDNIKSDEDRQAEIVNEIADAMLANDYNNIL